jgi:cystathionine beta-lyase/cystathionine gamma-synthase
VRGDKSHCGVDHSPLTPKPEPEPRPSMKLAALGVTSGYVRLSVGLDHIDDKVADLDQALAAA